MSKVQYHLIFNLLLAISLFLFRTAVLAQDLASVLESVCGDLRLNGCDRLAPIVAEGGGGPEHIKFLSNAIDHALRKEKETRDSLEKNRAAKYWAYQLARAFLNKQRNFFCYEPDCVPAHKGLEEKIGLMQGAGLGVVDYKGEYWLLKPSWLEEAALGGLNKLYVRQAFLEMTLLGWPGESCTEAYPFRCVIAKGERFLKDYPDSEISDQIRVELAQAYETWWSAAITDFEKEGLSGHMCGKQEDYIPGSEEARKKALRYYETLKTNPHISPSGGKVFMKKQPKTMEERLLRIERGENTFQHRYWGCIAC